MTPVSHTLEVLAEVSLQRGSGARREWRSTVRRAGADDRTSAGSRPPQRANRCRSFRVACRRTSLRRTPSKRPRSSCGRTRWRAGKWDSSHPLWCPPSNRTGLPARSSAAACAGPRRAAACTSRCLQAVSRRSKRSFSCASVTTLPPGRPSGPARRRRTWSRPCTSASRRPAVRSQRSTISGPCAIVADFGNNAGLIIGPELPDWRETPVEEWKCESFIDGVSAGRGHGGVAPGGPFESLRFLLGVEARALATVEGRRLGVDGAPSRACTRFDAGQSRSAQFLRSPVTSLLSRSTSRAPPARPTEGRVAMLTRRCTSWKGNRRGGAIVSSAACRRARRCVTAADVHPAGYPTVGGGRAGSTSELAKRVRRGACP